MEGDPKLLELQELIPGLQPGLGRSAREQALYQMAAVFSTMGVATLGGILTGFVCFDDELFFNVPPHYDCLMALNGQIKTDDSTAS
jgi:hypothetical protein